jgi:hypothetical protein
MPQLMELTRFELRELLLKHRPRDITEENAIHMLKLCDKDDPYGGTPMAYFTLDDDCVVFIEKIRREGRAASA